MIEKNYLKKEIQANRKAKTNRTCSRIKIQSINKYNKNITLRKQIKNM